MITSTSIRLQSTLLSFGKVERKLSRLPRPKSVEEEEQLAILYDLSQAIINANQDIYDLALRNPQGAKNFGPGRVVLLRDSVSTLKPKFGHRKQHND